MDPREHLKQRLRLYPHYSDEALDMAWPLFSFQKLKKGEILEREGEVARKVAFVHEGLLRTYYLNDGVEITNCFCREGGFAAAFSSLVSGLPSGVGLQSVEASTVVVAPYAQLKELFFKHIFWQSTAQLLAEHECISRENYSRLLSDHNAAQRYESVLLNEPDLLQRVPLVQLATYLQVKPETLSRIRKKRSIS
ncbi:MAG: Crp/Fnr family transcriptional regulator [Saprospiraceae bacterium]|nr:Crp/Fnr family transcriptional regulator [Saprospiraceae bacterium]